MEENNQKMTINDLAVITKEGFDEVHKQLDKLDEIEGRLGNLESQLDNLEAKVANLPDKGYLDDKLADLEGTVIVRQRKENQRVNLLVEFLYNKKILGDGEIKMLNEIQVFPKIEIAK